ncbi:MAG: efflux RND transporter periplasmic adaptor subunit [Planctomycetota bacterium]|jgi:multidrug efflux pump subunit AcrA (membrane-fusion protein)
MKKRFFYIAAAVLFAVIIYSLLRGSSPGLSEIAEGIDKYYTVKRGNFDITVTQTGRLEAIKRHDLKVGTSGRNKLDISWAIEDKSKVKKGDIIVKIDSDPFEQALEQLLTEYDNVKKDLILAQQDLEMGRSANLSNIKAAAEAFRKAKEELKRYEELDSIQKKKDFQAAIKKNESAVETAREVVEEAAEESSAASFEEESKRKELEEKLEAEEKKLGNAESALEKAYHALRVFKQYDYPQTLRSRKEGVAKAKLNLERIIKESQGLIIKESQKIRNHQTRINTLKSRIKVVREDISKLVVKAPIDGLVYLDNPNRRHWRTPKEIKVGTNVRSQEIIAYIPDLSKFMVKTDIPEEFRSRIELDLPARLRISAIPDLVMAANVSEIAPIASNLIPWDKNSQKVYATKLDTDAHDPRLMPGLTIDVEIIVKTVERVLFLPIEAVYNREGKTYARVKETVSIEEREVTTGESSLDFVEITEGIEEGEVVLLSRSTEKND